MSHKTIRHIIFRDIKPLISKDFISSQLNIKAMYSYNYPMPMVTADNVVFRNISQRWHVLLIKRKNEPFADCWALPGGFVDMQEDLETAAARELHEETGLRNVRLTQLQAFSDPKRDPRGRTITVAFCGVDTSDAPVCGSDDASQASWFPIDTLPTLAFDHDIIIQKAIDTALNSSHQQS